MNTLTLIHSLFLVSEVLNKKNHKKNLKTKDVFDGFKLPVVNNKPARKSLRDQFEEANAKNRTNKLAVPAKRTAVQMNRAMLNQTSPIASIVIPDIQPVLDIIINGAAEIYTQVNSLLGTTLTALQTIIDADFATVIPLVKAVIDTGNITLQTDFSAAFNAANVSITASFQSITTQENIDASNNVTQNNDALLAAIVAVLNQVEADVAGAVNTGVTASGDAVVAALTAANNSLYTQIEALLNNPNNTQPILPQLVYADSTVISALLTDTNNGVYQAVSALLNTAWTQIQNLINASAGTGVTTQTATLNTANEALLTVLNTDIATLLAAVQQSITTVTTDEVNQINQLLTNLAPQLTTDIDGVLNGLEGEITTIINTVTASQVSQTVALITSNNNIVLSAAVLILATA
ncbi:hypothetical protein COBT_001245 [Conglomerata obtusa]